MKEAVTRTAIGGKLRELRKAKKLTQWELADAVGVHLNYVSKVECGFTKRPSRATVTRLAEVLGADRDELLELAGRGEDKVG